jgi:glycopeptide antibiotics resistance protein
MLLKIIVYLAPIYIGIGLYINWVVHHKDQSLIHKTILFMFFVYTISVIYLTMFPFPLDQASLEFIQQFGYEKGMINLIPFKTSMSLKQAVLNFIMLAPLGVMLPIVYKTMKTRMIIMILVLTPLMIEVIQALGSWLMQGRWKQADINDFILNATGAIVGLITYRVMIKFFPKLKSFLLS